MGRGAGQLAGNAARLRVGLRGFHPAAGGPRLQEGRTGLNIVRAADLITGPLRAIGTAIYAGRHLFTAEARIVGPDGKLHAHSTTTRLMFDMPAFKAA